MSHAVDVVRLTWRWAVVAGAAAVLVLLPLGAQLLPAGGSSIGARTLLARIRSSSAVAYSGYAQSIGGVSLPVSNNEFSTVSDLFGSTQQLRVWWRGADDWRVDTIAATGETDLHRDPRGTWTWDYEADAARRYRRADAPAVRLPRTDDLVPPNLARRLLGRPTRPTSAGCRPSASPGRARPGCG